MPAYSALIALFPPQTSAGRAAYVGGSVIWCVVIVLLINRQKSNTKNQHAAELAELRQIIREEYAELARIRDPKAPILAPDAVDPSERLEELLRRERTLIGKYGIGGYGSGPYGGHDAWTIPAQTAAAIRQQQIVQQGDQDVLPQTPKP